MLKLKGLGNNENYNHIDIEKSQEFLDNLPNFLFDIGIEDEEVFKDSIEKFDQTIERYRIIDNLF